MPSYTLIDLADEDLDGIGLYSLEHWGLAKAQSYLTDLDACFGRLARDPYLGYDRSEIRPDLLSYPCNRHMIFFKRQENGDVIILRILGQSMDFERHL